MTTLGVILKSITLERELNLPFTGEQVRREWVVKLLLKLKIVVTITYKAVTGKPFSNVTT